jgi:hypothetical protein
MKKIATIILAIIISLIIMGCTEQDVKPCDCYAITYQRDTTYTPVIPQGFRWIPIDTVRVEPDNCDWTVEFLDQYLKQEIKCYE